MARVRYEAASRIYPGTDAPAVNELDLDIADGEFLVLVGPSGSGKSTALRMLAGLEFVDRGSVYINDVDVTLTPPRDRDIAMVFQNYALYPNMTVAANMGFALKQKGVPADERRKRVEEAARILDLEDYLDRKPKNLSGGQRQRVAMGRAIVREPQVFLMDEPLSNLDAKLRVQTRTELADLQARLGVTTVYVTHDQVEAMTMGDRVAVLNFGVLQQVDTPRNLYSRPSNLFVAGFIGSPAMNLISVAKPKGGVVNFCGQSHTLTADMAKDADKRKSGSFTFGVRPEHLSFSEPGSDSGAVKGRVTVVEELGSEAFVHVEVDGDKPDAKQTLVVRDEGETSITRDDNVEISITGPVHLFDNDGDRVDSHAQDDKS